MKSKFNKELILQISIIIACLVILFVNFSTFSTQAQSSCNGQPPLLESINPKKEAWAQGTGVTVVVFDTPDSIDFQLISYGIQLWNNLKYQNCSFVFYYEAVRAGRPYVLDETIPDNNMWVVRLDGRGSRLDRYHRYFGTPLQHVRAARMIIETEHNHTGVGTGALDRLAAHEAGHSMGVANEDFPNQPNRAIMGIAYPTPTFCDIEAVKRVYCPTPTQTPTPASTPRQLCTNPTPPDPNGFCPDGDIPQSNGLCCSTCGPGGHFKSQIGIKVENASEDQSNRIPSCCATDEQINNCYNNGGQWDYTYCQCGASPIVLDVAGNGINLTNNADGVRFNLNATGGKEQLSWTAAGSDDAWLVLDRNNNGTIDNGREMFGNFTLQPEPPAGAEKNGFLALAEFDKAANGGNQDGEITAADNVFASLRLWQDANHNGESEPNELHALQNLNVMKLELDYHESRKQDENGNRFKYQAKIKDARNSKIGRWAWDVYLTSAP